MYHFHTKVNWRQSLSALSAHETVLAVVLCSVEFALYYLVEAIELCLSSTPFLGVTFEVNQFQMIRAHQCTVVMDVTAVFVREEKTTQSIWDGRGYWTIPMSLAMAGLCYARSWRILTASCLHSKQSIF